MAYGKSKVHNRSHLAYETTFKGDTVVIPPGGYIEMGRRDAVELIGTYDNRNKPEGYEDKEPNAFINGNMDIPKMLRVEHAPIDGTVVEHACPFCAATFTSDGALQEHMRKLHPEQFSKNRHATNKETEVEKVTIWVCPECERECESKAGLAAHMRAHFKKDNAHDTNTGVRSDS